MINNVQKINYLIIALLCAVAQGAWAQTYVETEDDLRNAITDGAKIKLTQDIALSEKLEIASDKTVTIDLNGKTLSRSLSANENYGMVIYVNDGNLTINDGSGNNSGSIEGGRSYNGAGILCESGSTLIVNGGTFTNNDVSRTDNGNQGRGGAIFMNPNTTLTVTGGVFDGNSAYNGGAIYLDDGSTIGGTAASATISNAEFKNCWVTGDGGAIYNKGTLTVTGCTFTGNKATGVSGSGGGGLWNSSGSTLTLTDCTVTNNQCKGNGAGVNIHGDATLTDCTITGNTAGNNAGGMYVDASGKTVTLSGSNAITGNTATNNGGGIYVYSGSTINMSGCVNVMGNTGNDGCRNNLYLAGSTIITAISGFELDTRIGVSLENYNRVFTSGADTYIGGAGIYTCFEADVYDVDLSIKNDEAYLSNGGGILYVERTWEWNDENDKTKGGHVVATQKICRNYTTINENLESNYLNPGWYLISNAKTYYAYTRIEIIKGDVNFILEDGCDIDIKYGIYIKDGCTLTIYPQTAGTGKLRCTGSAADGLFHDNNASIGATQDSIGGHLVIHGGTITAKPSYNNGAAIGGAEGENSGMRSITIYGGTVTAEGMSSGAGIGCGECNNTKPTVNIYGGTVNATGGDYAAGIGGGEDRGNGTVNIYGGTVTATGGKYAAGIGGGEGGDLDSPVNIYGGTVTATGGENGAGIGGGKNNDGGGSANAKITIYGGDITATGGKYGAGIGGGVDGTLSNLEIRGGTVNATGGENGAGIGGGKNGNCYDVFVYDGEVHATGGKYCPGIGYAYGGSKEAFHLNVYGGYVESTSRGADAACIGGGRERKGGYFYITDGTVKAIYTNEYSSEYSGSMYIGRGGGYDGFEGEIILPDNYGVITDGVRATKKNRVDACHEHPSGYSVLTVEPCDHSGANYTVKDDDKHKINCSHCKVGDEDHDTEGEGGSCSKCGYGNGEYTVTIYEANEEDSGYGDATTYTMGYGVTFNLPECSNIPGGKAFVGWKKIGESESAPSSIEADDSEIESLEAAGSSFSVTENVTYYARYQTCWEGDGSGTADDPYQIKTEADWNYIANKVSGGNIHYDGKHFKLMNDDVSVSTQIGEYDSDSKYFAGTLDGDGHTLTVNFSGDTKGLAPFGCVKGATICDLHVEGTVESSAKFACGLIGSMKGGTTAISNCRVSATVSSSVSGDGTCGGFVGYINDGTVNFTRCVFDGTLSGSSATNWGGFVGWTEGKNKAKTNITNCLFKPSTSSDASTTNSSTFARSRNASDVTITNSYYTQAFGTTQGTQGYTIESGSDDIWLYYGEIDDGEEDEVLSDLRLHEKEIYPFDNGLLFQGKFYTGATTAVTFTPILPEGYEISSVTAVQKDDQTTSTGTLTDNEDGTYTLTMDGANTVVLTSTELMPVYSITLAEGTDDASDWTIDPASAYKGKTVTLTYTGTMHKMKSVTVLPKGVAAEDLSETIATNPANVTEPKQTTYTGKYATIEVTGGGDPDGTCVGKYDPMTITTNNGLDISSLVLKIGFWAYNAEDVTASSGNCTVSGDGNNHSTYVTVTDINAPSVTITSEFSVYVEQVQVNYDVPTVDWNASTNSGTFVMPAYDVEVNVAYQQVTMLTLKDDAENTTAIETAINDSTTTYNVVLEGRTLHKDGNWNTLCLPFDVTAKQIAGSDHPLHGAVIKELDVDGKYDSSGNKNADGTYQTGFKNSTLYLYFKDATEMEAGVPYIVRWDKPDDYVAYDGSNAVECSDIVNPEFKLSKVRGSEPGYIESADCKVRFIGNYDPTTLSGEYMTMLYLDGGSTLSHPDTDMSINAFRAHLQLDPSLGDVNSDGYLSVTDLMLLVNYILNENIDNFNVEKADINGDGNISVSDVMMLVNMILHTGTNLSVVVNGADGITFGGSATGTGSARAGKSTLWDDDLF